MGQPVIVENRPASVRADIAQALFLEKFQPGAPPRVVTVPHAADLENLVQDVRPDQPQFEKSLAYLNWAGKFIAGGLTQIRAAGNRYEVFPRGGA